MDVIVVAYPTDAGWEWEVFPDCEHGIIASSSFANGTEGARIFSIDVFDAVAAEIEKQTPWIDKE